MLCHSFQKLHLFYQTRRLAERSPGLKECPALLQSLTAKGKVLPFNSLLTGSVLQLFSIRSLQTQFSDSLENLSIKYTVFLRSCTSLPGQAAGSRPLGAITHAEMGFGGATSALGRNPSPIVL